MGGSWDLWGGTGPTLYPPKRGQGSSLGGEGVLCPHPFPRGSPGAPDLWAAVPGGVTHLCSPLPSPRLCCLCDVGGLGRLTELGGLAGRCRKGQHSAAVYLAQPFHRGPCVPGEDIWDVPCGVATTRVAKTRRALAAGQCGARWTLPVTLWGEAPCYPLSRVGGGAEARRLSVSQREPLWVFPGLGRVA